MHRTCANVANAVQKVAQNSPVTAGECESDIKRFRVLLFSSRDYLASSRPLAFNQPAPDPTAPKKRSDVAASIWINKVPAHGYNFSRRHLKWEDTLHYKNVGMSP